MNDRQRAIIDAATDALVPHVQALSHDQIGELLYNLVLDCGQPPRLDAHNAHESTRRAPMAGEVLPPHQRASWAQKLTIYDLQEVA
jgi:hypothetical protein